MLVEDSELVGVIILDIGTGRWFEEVGEECSVDQIHRRDWGDGVYDRGRWGWRWDGGNQCANNSGG